MSISRTQLVRNAAFTAGISPYGSVRALDIEEWLQAQINDLLVTHDFAWTFKLLKSNQFQEIDSDNDLYEYAYQFNSDVLGIYGLNLELSADDALNRRFRRHTYWYDIGDSFTSVPDINYTATNILYSNTIIESAIVKRNVLVDEMPADFTKTLELLVAAVYARGAGRDAAANKFQSAYQTRLAAIVARGSQRVTDYISREYAQYLQQRARVRLIA